MISPDRHFQPGKAVFPAGQAKTKKLQISTLVQRRIAKKIIDRFVSQDRSAPVAGSHGISTEMVSVTVNLNTNFMAPHRGDTAVAEGELIRSTRSLFFAQSKLIDPESNRLCAVATGTFKRQTRSSEAPIE